MSEDPSPVLPSHYLVLYFDFHFRPSLWYPKQNHEYIGNLGDIPWNGSQSQTHELSELLIILRYLEPSGEDCLQSMDVRANEVIRYLHLLYSKAVFTQSHITPLLTTNALHPLEDPWQAPPSEDWAENLLFPGKLLQSRTKTKEGRKQLG